jgi:hypothetical protein
MSADGHATNSSRKAPGFTVRYQLGVELARHLDPVCGYEEIGAALGITKQNAYTETMLALGHLGLRLRRRLRAR